MKPLKDRKVLLVGGAGFIGHHLALQLKSRGVDVEIIDGLEVNNLLAHTESKSPHRDRYLSFINQRFTLLREAGIPLHVLDARDFRRTKEMIQELKPDTVVQLAAVAHANVSNKEPYACFDHSFKTLENVIESCKETADHFVFFSSSMVYGNFTSGEVTEDTPCNPLGMYGTLKYCGEKLVMAYNQIYDLDYTIIRPSALYGPRCVSRRVGQIFNENAVSGKDCIIQGDGSDRLDFTYIKDLVHGIELTLENREARNQVFNLTYGESRTIGQMAELIQENYPNIKVEYQPKDRLTPDRGTLSVEKAKKLIGYNPQYPLEKGYVEYIQWYKENVAQ